MQCWRMVRALRSHGTRYLVVFFWRDVAVRYSFLNFLCDLPSVDHWLVNHAVRPERSLRLLSNVYLRGVIGNNLAGPIIRPSSLTVTSLHDITGSFTSCYKPHRLLTRLWLLHNVVLSTRLQDVIQRSSITNSNPPIGCHSVTSWFSDDPLTQFTTKPFFATLASAWGHL